MMRQKNLFILWAILMLSAAMKPVIAWAEKPVKIYVGIYPLKIDSFMLKDEKFEADFYIWFSWKGQKKLPGFEIMNGTYQFIGDPEVDELPGGFHYEAYRIKGKFNVMVDLRSYPFDRHSLEIQIENQEMDCSKFVYVPDTENIKHLLNISKLTGWRTTSVKVFERPHVYETNFGKKNEASTSTYSQLVYRINVERKIFSYVMKSSFPLFIIVFMSLLALWVHPDVVGVRASIGITTLLSIVAFHLAQSNILPDVGHMVTADYFFMLAYLCCALSLVETVVTNRIYVQKKMIAEAMHADRKVFLTLTLLFISGYALVIFYNLCRIHK